TKVAMRWIGINPLGVDVEARAQELAGMIAKAATIGPPNWLARARRRRTEQWAAQLIADIREGTVQIDADAPLSRLAHHRDHDGSLMSLEAAAVEVINVLRPTVAVGRFIVFAAYALHRHPDWRER